MWRSRDHLPNSLVFHDNYLGKDQITITLNFSKSAMNVVGQLYQFVRLGFAGYKAVCEHMLSTRDALIKGLEGMGVFEIISDAEGLPLVAFHLKDDGDRGYDEFHIADRLRMFGWVVPAYTLAKGNDSRKVLRIVCRCDLGPLLVEELLEDLEGSLAYLKDHHTYTTEQIHALQQKAMMRRQQSTTGRVRGLAHSLTLNQRGHC